MTSSAPAPSTPTADSAEAAARAEARRKKRDEEYIPAHLRSFVFHSQDDFYVSRFFDPVLLAHLMYEGFLPIASEFRGQCFLLPKLHRQRCIQLLVDGEPPPHVPRSVKKRARRYTLVLNRDFDAVVAGCHEKHGVPWLYPPIVKGFRALFEAGDAGVELFPGRVVRFFSVELRDAESGVLAAGELGYTTGRSYTSLTGFSRVSGAGTVQLHALGRLLYLSGAKMWDLGMSMAYKTDLGAVDVDRDVFLEHLRRWRGHDCALQLDCEAEGDLRTAQGVRVKALLELSRPPRVFPPLRGDASDGDRSSGEHQDSDSGGDERERKKTKRGDE